MKAIEFAHPTGSTSEQASYRNRVLAITGGRCIRCGSALDVEAHHVDPIGIGGDSQGPGVPLCKMCHRLAHRGRCGKNQLAGPPPTS